MDEKTNEIKEKMSTLLWYFVGFSIFGMAVEMIYCYVTTGVLESRQGLVWGPFCPIYGVGAVIAILALEKIKDNKIKLFIGGALLGGMVEYILSYLLEAMYGSRFWDYSYTTYNLNGRISFLYSVFWGILAIIVIGILNPIFTDFIKKIHKKKTKYTIEIIVFAFFVVDTICTVWAVSAYKTRAKNIYYQNNPKNSKFYTIGEKIFPNEYMLRAFPNIRFVTNEGKEVYIKNIIK